MTPVRPKYESIEDIFDEIAQEQQVEPMPRSANATVRPLAQRDVREHDTGSHGNGPGEVPHGLREPNTSTDTVSSGTLDDSDIIDIIAEESRMSPQPKVSERTAVPPGPNAPHRDVVTSLRETREVIGFTVQSVSGALTHEGVCDDRFQERILYFAHLAGLVGKELGLEPLREMHIVGESRRVATFVGRDGSRTTVVTEPSYETQALSRSFGR